MDVTQGTATTWRSLPAANVLYSFDALPVRCSCLPSAQWACVEALAKLAEKFTHPIGACEPRAAHATLPQRQRGR